MLVNKELMVLIIPCLFDPTKMITGDESGLLLTLYLNQHMWFEILQTRLILFPFVPGYCN